MKTNLGKSDRIIRLLIAGIIAGLYFSHTVSGTLGTVLLIVGIVMMLTAAISNCPLYSLMGINSCRQRETLVTPQRFRLVSVSHSTTSVILCK